ncbi:hypothetical protein [uncultured Umboniibacter sp.]|uniref:hypothetical protein n=1 Tax=uncultured Umboniibacter sp. TaxID=1798917 RepID=UPI002636F63C|nr:hypothetical protein [uncultured Umboniibacter sp.]
MTKLIATSVVRGSQQGQSHGGVFLIDLKTQSTEQVLDWDKMDIDWQGRGWDRGLRGICIIGETIYIAASDELFAYNTQFECIGSWKNNYLKHCHEIFEYRGTLFITSTAYDAIIGFDPKSEKFHWAIQLDTNGLSFSAKRFDPNGHEGPLMLNKMHINNVHCNDDGMYISGLKTGGMLHFNGKNVNMSAQLPPGTHNAQPYQDGVLFNDTKADAVRFASRDSIEDECAFPVPQYPVSELTGMNLDESKLARPGFGRGLCVVAPGIIAAGSSPSTIAIHDMNRRVTGLTVQLTNDVRHAIHGLEVYPF